MVRVNLAIIAQQGESTWAIGRATAKMVENGTVEGYIGTITDIDKISATEAAPHLCGPYLQANKD